MRNTSSQVRERLLALRWRILEAMGDSRALQLGLGVADLLCALAYLGKGQPYLALEASSRTRRILQKGWFERLANALQARILARTSRDSSGRSRPMAENQLIDAFLRSSECERLLEPVEWHSWARLVRMGGELMLLKEPDDATGELGVVILKYNGSFGRFHHFYDVPKLMDRYQLVLEPSWIGYQDPTFLLYLDPDRRVVVQAQYPPDFQVIEQLGSNLLPVEMGAGNWVDPEIFRPMDVVTKDYLAVLIANWAPLKRHYLAFDALERIDDPTARIALVGYPWKSFSKDWLVAEVERRGLSQRVDFYESVSRKEVNELLNRSYANLILSRKEGASKALYEGLAAGTPCVLTEDHGGNPVHHINAQTGVYCPMDGLHDALLMMRDEAEQFSPSEWWQENVSIPASIRELESRLSEDAAQRERPFTRGLHPKKNDPGLAYLDEDLYASLMPAYRELAKFLKPEHRKTLASLPAMDHCRT